MSARATHCRACCTCCAEGLEPILDRGALSLAYCARCALVQLLDRGDAERSDGARANVVTGTDARSLVRRVIKERRLTGDSLVVEVSCGDGSLLQRYREAGVPVLGIEPARDVAAVAEARGISVLCDDFGTELAEELALTWRQADVIHANDALDRALDLNGFVHGLARLLRPDGVAVVEVPYVRDMVEARALDTLRCDRLSYFSLTSLAAVFRRGGLAVADVERTPAAGGSLRAFARRADAADVSDSGRSAAVYALAAEERALRMHRPEYYHVFADRVRALDATAACNRRLTA